MLALTLLLVACAAGAHLLLRRHTLTKASAV